MTIAQQIEEIIHRRENDIRPRYDALWNQAKPVIDFAYELKKLINSPEWKLLLSKNPSVKAIWEKEDETVRKFIDLVINRLGEPCVDADSDCIITNSEGETLYELADNLDAVKQRVNKTEVEVCVMGPISTGKSVFMQGLTGAPDYVIPDGRKKTTAARTTFMNIPKDGKRRAVVHFLSKKEFKKIFNTYVEQLNKVSKGRQKFPIWDGEGSFAAHCEKIKKCDSFATNQFTKDVIPGIGTLVEATAYFDTFAELYVQFANDIEKYIEHPDIPLDYSKIQKGDLIPYVSYKKQLADKDVTSGIALAVKEVEVYWPLETSKHENLGRLNLVDTMGIGEPKFSVEEDLLDIIRKRADLAIALCKIQNDGDDLSTGHPNDPNFLKVLSKLKKRHPQNWVYYLANNTAGTGISPETEGILRDALWTEMAKGDAAFSLNKNYWRAYEFMNKIGKKYVVNREQITSYFVETVLANLKNDIEIIDKQFISQAESDLKDTLEMLPELELLFVKTDKESIDVSDEDSLLNTTTKIAMNRIASSLQNERNAIAKENAGHCERIINEIYPLLCYPEIFSLYNIEIPNEKNLFITWDGKSENLKDLRHRELLIYMILNEFNSYRINPDNHKLSFADAKTKFIQEVGQSDKWKDSKDDFEELLKDEFFSDYYQQTGEAIIGSQCLINPQTQYHDVKKEVVFKNNVGRELQFFYEIREKILYGILNRLETTECKGVKKSLTDYFADETDKVINRICKSIYLALVQENIVDDDQGPESDYSNWFSSFVRQSKGKKLLQVIDEFLETKINLNEIVIHKQADTLLNNLCRVQLSYLTPNDAAYSFFACLFSIDRHLRWTLWQMYVRTFEDFGIYTPCLNIFINTVFGLKRGEVEDETEEYREFAAIIRNIKKASFATSTEGKLVRAKNNFDECYNNLNNLKK